MTEQEAANLNHAIAAALSHLQGAAEARASYASSLAEEWLEHPAWLRQHHPEVSAALLADAAWCGWYASTLRDKPRALLPIELCLVPRGELPPEVREDFTGLHLPIVGLALAHA